MGAAVNDRLANRIAGFCVAIFGAALILWIMPAHTETVSSGWIKPQTLPRACGIGLIALGLWLAAFPGGDTKLSGYEAGMVTLCAALSAGALWAMGRYGFLAVAPILAACLVAMIGERRWPWIAASVLGAPAIIWLVVPVLLGRPLP